MDNKQLTPKFNAKCYKDFKVGKRTRPDGTVNLWQGNKLVGVIPAKTSMFIDNASSILHRHREDGRVSQLRINPEGIKFHPKPGIQ